VLVDRLLPRALLRPIVLVDLLPKVTLITISKNKADHVRGGGSYAGTAGSNSSAKRRVVLYTDLIGTKELPHTLHLPSS
jgi:hypothetical protein